MTAASGELADSPGGRVPSVSLRDWLGTALLHTLPTSCPRGPQATVYLCHLPCAAVTWPGRFWFLQGTKPPECFPTPARDIKGLPLGDVLGSEP